MTESAIQMQIAQAFNERGILFFSVPNEALGKIKYRGDRNRMMRLKAMGLLAGAPDLVVVLPNAVVFMEVKAGGFQSEKQIEFQERAESLGYKYVVVRSKDDALAAIAT